MAIRGQTGESAPRRWRSDLVAPPKKTAHTLIRIVEEIENQMGEMSTPQKHVVFGKLTSNFVVLVFPENEKLRNEYGTSVAQAFLEFNMGGVEVVPGVGQKLEDWRYSPADGKGEAPSAGS